MVGAPKHDLFALFGFAVREHDWVLADEIANRLLAERDGRMRLKRELRRIKEPVASPGSLRSLELWSALARDLDLG
jgi:hypothetical protein